LALGTGHLAQDFFPTRNDPNDVRRILVIDDEDDIREVAQLSLEMVAGWEVLPARSGAEGIERARAESPDAILLDVMMPGLDGPATFRLLRDDPATASIPVILLTAKVHAADRERFQGLGVDGVLTKPFDPMELSRQVAEVLGWPA
jgi:CheY-like chemotaxis protein